MCVEHNNTISEATFWKSSTAPIYHWAKSYVGPADFYGIDDFNGIEFPASIYIESYVLRTAEPILKWQDKVVGTKNIFGKGAAYLIGTFPANINMQVEKNDGFTEFLDKILSTANIKYNKVDGLLIRKLNIGTKEAWFLINNHQKSASVELDVKNFKNAECLLSGTKQAIGEVCKIAVPPLDVRCLILE